jgi:TRAP-type uncharacterized transport system substrate-binding protein
MKIAVRGALALCVLGVLAVGDTAKAEEIVPTATFCGGPEGGRYNALAVDIAQHLKGIVAIPKDKIKPTAGSVENLMQIEDGGCDMAIVQKDTLVSFNTYRPVSRLAVKRMLELGEEWVYFLCNAKAFDGGIKSLKGKDWPIAIGERQSGTEATWRTVSKVDQGYASLRPVQLGGVEALVEVEEGRIPCMLWVASTGSSFIQDAAATGRNIHLLDFDDKEFVSKGQVDGTPVYDLAQFPTRPEIKALHGTGTLNNTETIRTPMTLVVSVKWYEANRPAYIKALAELRRVASDFTK